MTRIRVKIVTFSRFWLCRYTNMAETRKQIAFDLDTKALEKYYPGQHWRGSYEIIKRHMLKNDFEWLQGSVYVSARPMSSAETTRILGSLVKRNPWLNLCMRDCREANIGREHSKNYIFDKDANIPASWDSKISAKSADTN